MKQPTTNQIPGEQDFISVDTLGAIEALINCTNKDLEHYENTAQELLASKEEIAKLREDLEKSKGEVFILYESGLIKDDKLVELSSELETANILATKGIAMKERVTIQNETIRKLQEEITASKAGSAARHKALASSRKETIISNKAEIKRLNAKVNELNQSLSRKDRIIEAKEASLSHHKQRDENKTILAAYHNGDHHLNWWHIADEQENEDGEIVNVKSILHMHQSGVAQLIKYDLELNESRICKRPANGLRPLKACMTAATEWLYKVNIEQGGKVTDNDMVCINYYALKYGLHFWEEPITLRLEDGSAKRSLALLYIHEESGCGSLVMYDALRQSAVLCKSPAAGSQPSDECMAFAEEALFNVNVIQDGKLTAKDLIPLDFNTNKMNKVKSKRKGRR